MAQARGPIGVSYTYRASWDGDLTIVHGKVVTSTAKAARVRWDDTGKAQWIRYDEAEQHGLAWEYETVTEPEVIGPISTREIAGMDAPTPAQSAAWERYLHETYGFGLNDDQHSAVFSQTWMDGHASDYAGLERRYVELAGLALRVLAAQKEITQDQSAQEESAQEEAGE